MSVHACFTLSISFTQLVEIDSLLKEVDRRTGIAKCRDVIMRLDYLSDDQVLIVYLKYV